MINIHAAVAVTPSFGIGYLGELPWVIAGTKFSKDLAYFRQVTTQTNDPNKRNAVIMGRRTWESIKDKYRPLKARLNVILTRDNNWAQSNLPKEVLHANSIESALSLLESSTTTLYPYPIENAVVIGGSQLFEEALLHPKCTQFHVTYIDNEYNSDTYLTEKTINYLKATPPYYTSEDFEENGVNMRYALHSIIIVLCRYFIHL